MKKPLILIPFLFVIFSLAGLPVLWAQDLSEEDEKFFAPFAEFLNDHKKGKGKEKENDGYLFRGDKQIYSLIGSWTNYAITSLPYLGRGWQETCPLPPPKTLKEVAEQFPEETFTIPYRDIRKRTPLEMVLRPARNMRKGEGNGNEDEGEEKVKIPGVPFLVHRMILTDVPVNPVSFVDGNMDPPQVFTFPGTSRGDQEGVRKIFNKLQELVANDPHIKNISPKAYKRNPGLVKILQNSLHQSLVGRVQGFDHIMNHKLTARFLEICSSCFPLLFNNENYGDITFIVKEGKILAKTSMEFLVREEGRSGLPVEVGKILVDRIAVIDIMTGIESEQLVHWRKSP